jgi:4-aminobutyrate aminotransferase-like enzyme
MPPFLTGGGVIVAAEVKDGSTLTGAFFAMCGNDIHGV